MAAPILDKNATFAHGSSFSFTMAECGTFTGHVHPPGEAYRFNPSPVVDNKLVFLESTNRYVRGKCQGFVCASSVDPFSKYHAGEHFTCDLILLMGINISADKTITYYYYTWDGGALGDYDGSVGHAIHSLHTPVKFIKKMFGTKLHATQHGKLHIKYLYQISGPMFTSLHHPPVLTDRKYRVKNCHGIEHKHYKIDENTINEEDNTIEVTNFFHEQGMAPDRWLPEGYLDKDQEKLISFLTPVGATRNIDIFNKLSCDDDVGKASGCRKIMNFANNPTVYLFVYRKEYPDEVISQVVDEDGNVILQKFDHTQLVWIPLPTVSDNDEDDFVHLAGLTIQEKDKLDYEMNDIIAMSPSEFRNKLEMMSLKNCGKKYVTKRRIVIGGTINGQSCYNYVVSCINDEDAALLESWDSCERIDDSTFMMMDKQNVQDPYLPGIVIWRIYPLPVKGVYTREHVDLTHATLPNAGLKRGFPHKGHFSMAFTRQTGQSNGSMNQVSSPTHHMYCDQKQIDVSLAPLTSSIFNTLSSVTTHASDVSGQVLIGTIKKALQYEYKGEQFCSQNICPSIIHTSPRYIKDLDVWEAFYNMIHRDPHDVVDKETNDLVMDYVANCNCPILQAYFDKLFDMFDDVLPDQGRRVPLPTTCAYKLIEKLEGVEHHQYFVVEGLALDLSSNVFDNDAFEYIGNTFLGRLSWHNTSAPIAICKKTGYVTTNMQGLCGLQAWGSSGGYAYIQARGSARNDMIVQVISRYMERHNGQRPRRLPGVRITDFFTISRRGRVIGGPRPPPPQEGSRRTSRSSGKRNSRSGKNSTTNKKNASASKTTGKKRKANDGSQSTKKNNNKQRRKSGPANAGTGSTTERSNNNRRDNNEVEAAPTRNNTHVRGDTRFRIGDLNSRIYRSAEIGELAYQANLASLDNVTQSDLIGYESRMSYDVRVSIDRAVLESIRADRGTWPPIVGDVFRRIPETGLAHDELSILIRARIIDYFMDPDEGGHAVVLAMNERR